MEAAAQTLGLQTDGSTEEWKSANNLYDKVFFFYQHMRQSHRTLAKPASPFYEFMGA